MKRRRASLALKKGHSGIRGWICLDNTRQFISTTSLLYKNYTVLKYGKKNLIPNALTTCDKHCIKNERGAVAQLGERMTGSHEAEGSIPFSSTIFLLNIWAGFQLPPRLGASPFAKRQGVFRA
jgi:hypothetical protein